MRSKRPYRSEDPRGLLAASKARLGPSNGSPVAGLKRFVGGEDAGDVELRGFASSRAYASRNYCKSFLKIDSLIRFVPSWHSPQMMPRRTRRPESRKRLTTAGIALGD
jgi:hypothetical protein